MTVNEILLALQPHKSLTREGLYLHLRALRIKALGRVKQIPAQYPDDTPEKVLNRLGLVTTARPRRLKVRVQVNGRNGRKARR